MSDNDCVKTKSDKGFASILIVGIIVVFIAVGTGGYLYIANQGKEKAEKNVEIPTNKTPETGNENETQTNPEIPVTGPESVPEKKGQTATPPPKPVPAPPVVEKPVVQNVCSRIFIPKFGQGPHYLGPLFDAHFHLPSFVDYTKMTAMSHDGVSFSSNSATSPILDKDVMLADIICTLKKEKERGIIGFGIGSEEVMTEALQSAKSIRQRASEFIHIFLAPVGFSAATLENIQTSNAGLLEGYGELSFGYGGGLQSNQYPDDQNFLDIYKVAGNNNLVVMIHIGAQQQSRIENILQKNPNVKFLFHGPESENFIHNIIGKYPNAYYSVDAMLIRLPGAPGALMYTVNSKDEFKTKFSQNYQTMLENSINQWKSKIEQYPDRYMWGTDRAYKWTYDEDISLLIEEFGRAFVGKLDQAVREKFAYKNAESLLNK